MKKLIMICLVSLVLVLGLVGDVQADDIDWTDDGPDHLWSTPTNWSTGTVPTSSDVAIINLVPGPIVDPNNVDAVAGGAKLGYAGHTGELTMDGGTLALTWSNIGEDDTGYGILNMNSGTITINSLTVGDWGDGTINMTGGTIRVWDTFMIAGDSKSAIGHVNLDGGTITAGDFMMAVDKQAVATMDVGAGTLILNGDQSSLVQGYIDDGWITCYDGQVTCTLSLDYDVTHPESTTLKGISLLEPSPAIGEMVLGGDVELSWTNLDPNEPGDPVFVDVWFGSDPNDFNDYVKVVSAGENATSVTVSAPEGIYFWQVNSYLGGSSTGDPVESIMFHFIAVTDLPPTVNAGADIVSWADQATQLEAIVDDDGASTLTILWTSDNENVVISDTSIANPTVTLANETGEPITVTFTIAVNDEVYTTPVEDSIIVTVYPDACQAARVGAGLAAEYPGDSNGDCVIDLVDFAAEMAAKWLADYALTAPVSVGN
jgi:hypothetical protein